MDKKTRKTIRNDKLTEIIMNTYWHGFSDGQVVETGKHRPDYLLERSWIERRGNVLEIALHAIEKVVK